MFFNNDPPIKCKHCKRPKGQHKAVTFNCPIGRARRFPQFNREQTFEAKSPTPIRRSEE